MVAEKATTGLFVGLLAYIVGQVNFLTVCLVAFIVIDFGTGILATWAKGGKYSNEIATKGFIKKTGILILWLVAVIVQLAIITEGAKLGIVADRPYIVLGITFYLIGSEGVSIIANLDNMGVKTPKWFKKQIKSLEEVNSEEKGA
jgi:toxin secretion/phage lysis holin